MATFNAQEADNYGNGGGSFFSLKNDKDVATIRFMYNTIADVEGYAVHEVEVDGKKKYVNCLRSYNEPVDNCPLCAAKFKVVAKVFIPVYNVELDETQTWDRGKTFISKLSSLCARYNPLVSTPFEIERNGKKGDTNTTYETYALQTDGTQIEDLPEPPQILGGLVLDKTFEDMEDYLATGSFPADGDAAPAPQQQQRNPQADKRPAARNTQPQQQNDVPWNGQNQAAATPGRRTQPAQNPSNAPAGGRRRTATNTDKF